MKIYISGPISSLPIETAKAKFMKSVAQVRAIMPDAEIINPLELNDYNPDKRWSDYMIPCLDTLKDCDMIVMQSTWKSSPGSRIELAFAKACGNINVRYLVHGKLVVSSSAFFI